MGLEKTPEEFVANMVAVFREVRRVLRDDGTLWLNIGDSYATGAGAVGNCPGGGTQGENWRGKKTSPNRMPIPGLKPKDLCGIPWRLAFALQADGWWLRSEIIWHKPNPMPESVTDRPTKSHEQIFLLTKAERYFYDAEAVREPAEYGRSEWRGNQNDVYQHGLKAKYAVIPGDGTGGRNLRTVWTIPTQPYSGSHFATFPEDLAERCIKAGTSERGACSVCGRPWVRIVEGTPYTPEIVEPGVRRVDESRADKTRKLSGAEYNRQVKRTTTGWEQLCGCGAEPAPCLVLDPFFGSGTVGRVCRHLRRNCIGIDLNADYLGNQARARVSAPLDRDVAKQAESIPGQKTMF